ncbi:MAG TPA: ACR3 family arsenite efflux transporter [Nitrososphaeraceae archaeon]|nr:ACR3 family arsenite efflux transporter [Nitrososphaeraceae archaeon]
MTSTGTKIYEKELDVFSKYLSLWVAICILSGTLVGYFFPSLSVFLAELEYANVSLPIAAVLLIMMYPIMLKVRYSELLQIRKNAKVMAFTLIINWTIQPFAMAIIAWFFMTVVFSSLIPEKLAKEYMMGMIILGLAPCTAMTLVWTYLAKANLSCALIQVSINDLIILILYAPIGIFLLGITSGFSVPLDTLFLSILLYVAVPLGLAALTRLVTNRTKGEEWLETHLISKVEKVTPIGLLITLILIFIFQGDKIIAFPYHLVLIATALTIHTYLIFSVGYFGAKKLRIPYAEAAPTAFIGASNFFELAVAVSTILFGVDSGVTLAITIGVLVEVPVMLSLVAIMKRNKSKFDFNIAR